MIDTGVDPSNPDLVGKIAAWNDFVNGRATPYDDGAHGTHVAGTLVGGAVGGGAIGVAPGRHPRRRQGAQRSGRG